MAIKNQIAKIASKEMNRRDFLKYSGLALLSMIGLSHLLRISSLIGEQSERKSNYYGSSSFGK